MASFVYDSCLRDTFRARFNFDNDAFCLVLLGSGYRPDKEQHSRRSDLTDEVSGQGYDGAASVAVRMSMVDGVLNLALGGTKLANATISARYAAYCADRGGTPEDDELIALIDFGMDVTSTNGEYLINASSLKIQN